MVRCVVSVEGLPLPARAAVLKSLQTRLALAALSDSCPPAAPAAAAQLAPRLAPQLALLVGRLRALARLPEGAHALWTGSWLLAEPRDPLLRRLHRDLGRAVASRLLPPQSATKTKHVMLCLTTASADEAFEAVLENGEDGGGGGGGGGSGGGGGGGGSGGGGAICLQSLREAQERIEELARAGGGGALSPFADVEAVEVRVPPFAADNPATLARLLDLACQGCHRAMHRHT